MTTKTKLNRLLSLAILIASTSTGFAQKVKTPDSTPSTNATELATYGGGCFWCVEAIFQRLDGVKSVASGYAGGKKDNPTYEEVCTGQSGHAEVIQIEYDPKKISFNDLLDVFWLAHDPTTPNRQGADRGTQYRSVIFYHDEKQKLAAEASKKTASPQFKDPIVTEISPLPKFFKAEGYHQNYFNRNPNASYCTFVIRPKLDKVLQKLSKPKK